MTHVVRPARSFAPSAPQVGCSTCTHMDCVSPECLLFSAAMLAAMQVQRTRIEVHDGIYSSQECSIAPAAQPPHSSIPCSASRLPGTHSTTAGALPLASDSFRLPSCLYLGAPHPRLPSHPGGLLPAKRLAATANRAQIIAVAWNCIAQSRNLRRIANEIRVCTVGSSAVLVFSLPYLPRPLPRQSSLLLR